MEALKALNYDKLVSDYAAMLTDRKLAIDATALRMESSEYRDLLAHLSTNGKLTYRQLKELVLHGRGDIVEAEVTNPLRLASLGRVALLQQYSPEDETLGIACLKLASELMPNKGAPLRFRRLLIQNAIVTGQVTEAKALLNKFPDIDQEHFGYLRAELQNPFHFSSPDGSHDVWLSAFNRPFIEAGLQPVQLTGTGPTAFDLLEAKPHLLPSVDDPPLVSVVLTTYQPDRATLNTSVKSILNQSWPNLELIIVDDASGESYGSIIDEVASSDDRIKLITCSQNGGTYQARNVGYAAADGAFITGQDDDDWSHPKRLQLQVQALMEHEKAPASRARAISCGNDLNRVRLGYLPEGANASSLMIRRELFEESGGFLPIRKAADNEFANRIEIISGEKIVEVDKPLSLIRILDDSLSRSHFRPGWQHPSRRQFKSAYGHWHRSARKSELKINQSTFPPVSIPRALRKDPDSFPQELDVVFAGDWRQFGGPQKSMMEEIRALKKAGYKIGILHLEAARFMTVSNKPLCDPIQELVNDGTVQEVLYDDPVNIQLLILRYPPIVQFKLDFKSQLRAQKMIVLANQAPAEKDGTDVRYIPPICDANAKFMFGVQPLWVPQGPQVGDALQAFCDQIDIAPFNMPGLIDVNEWTCNRDSPRSVLPVVGRHSRDNPMKWPGDEGVLRTVYPTRCEYDVRILGGAEVPKAMLGTNSAPAGWTVYGTNEISPRQFLHSLDFYVFYPHEQSIEAFGRAILEAIASGLVVILPPSFERVFGEGAIYREPKDVKTTVRFYINNPDRYKEQSRCAVATVEQDFSHKMYQELVSEILRDNVSPDIRAPFAAPAP